MARYAALLLLVVAGVGALHFTAAQEGCPVSDGLACGGHGNCTAINGNMLCECERGYTGAACGVSGCPDPACGGHGRCDDPLVDPSVDVDVATCICDEGYGGHDCTTRGCDPPCVDAHGTCGASGTCECLPGWTGQTCADHTCGANATCSNHGTCGSDFRCVCDQGYGGSVCENAVVQCPDPTCSGHGSCDSSTGECACVVGFTGPDCSTTSCPGGCGESDNRGKCVNNVCECSPGFTGADCSRQSCPNNCGTHGRCSHEGESKEQRCICDNGWTGADCGQEACPGQCNGHGVCTASNSTGGHHCECAAGYRGAGCSDCDGRVHCNSHGSCTFDAAGDPLCVCRPGFGGLTCSDSMCPKGRAYDAAENAPDEVCSGRGSCKPAGNTFACRCQAGYGSYDCHASCPTGRDGNTCSGHGTCAAHDVEGTYGVGKCFCARGWAGEACGEHSCPSAVPNNGGDAKVCSGLGQGVCVHSLCYCRNGWAPPDCSRRECPNDCSGNGVCMDDGRCACNSGFAGDDCAEPACCDSTCSGNGKCIVGRCHCDPGFGGSSCEIQRVNATGVDVCAQTLQNCNGHGDCDEQRQLCLCDSGYSGRFCQDHECPMACNHHGQCVSGNCQCEDGWGGIYCQKRVCTNDCNGRGYCINGTCFCREGWTGAACAVRGCKNNCNNVGVCKAGVCACLNGYSGEDCSVKPCPGWVNGKSCSGHGMCRDSKCYCTGRHAAPFDEPMFEGVDCATPTCPSGVFGKKNACSNHGTCNNGKCECAPGWRGIGCHIPTCDACSDRGECDESADPPVCRCKRGWSGPRCSQKSCDWDPVRGEAMPGCHQDLGHGVCVNSTCFCHKNYTGRFCEQPACRNCDPIDRCPNRCNEMGTCNNGKCDCAVGFSGDDCSIVTSARPAAPENTTSTAGSTDAAANSTNAPVVTSAEDNRQDTATTQEAASVERFRSVHELLTPAGAPCMRGCRSQCGEGAGSSCVWHCVRGCQSPTERSSAAPGRAALLKRQRSL